MTDLFDTLRRLLPGTNADGSQLSDANLLARAIDKITTLQSEADLAAWRSVEDEPPPQRADVLFYSDGSFWVGYAQEVVVHDSETGTEFTELNYFCDDDLMDGDPPTAWCPIPTTGEHDPDE